MRFYNHQHQYYCGIDLHVKTMYVCILDATGQVLVHRNVPSTPEAFLEAVGPYRADAVVSVECMFTWYWLADLCAAESITFVLGHALAMKAIHGGKAKNDKIDSHKIAVLLRGGMLPQAYVYPAGMRSTRDLLLTSRWPSNSWTVRMSVPSSSRCVANECRKVWHETRFAIPVRREAAVTAR